MMRMPFEKPATRPATPGQWLADSGGHYALSALVGFLACAGPVAIVLTTGARGGLSESDISSWLFGAFFLNGFFTIALSLIYRQPLALFWSIPGAVLVGLALTHLSYAEERGNRPKKGTDLFYPSKGVGYCHNASKLPGEFSCRGWEDLFCLTIPTTSVSVGTIGK
jgi:hypothetical protein